MKRQPIFQSLLFADVWPFEIAMALTLLFAIANCACAGEPISQLRLAAPDSAALALGSVVSTNGFPAISESGGELAILKSIDAHQSSAILEISSTADTRLLKRFVLLSDVETEGAWNQHMRERVKADMVEPNAYLSHGKFRAMEQLFELAYPSSGTFPRPATWEHEYRDLRISIDYSSAKLRISSLESNESLLEVTSAVEKIGPLGGVEGEYCFVQGVPARGWISEAGNMLVIYLKKTGGGDSCDHPEEWLVRRFRSEQNK